MQTIGNFFQTIWDFLRDTLLTIANYFIAIFGAILEWLDIGIFSHIRRFFSFIANIIVDIFWWFGEVILSWWEDGFLGGVWYPLLDWLNSVYLQFEIVVVTVLTFIYDLMIEFYDFFANMIGLVFTVLGYIFSFVGDLLVENWNYVLITIFTIIIFILTAPAGWFIALVKTLLTWIFVKSGLACLISAELRQIGRAHV